MRRAPKKDGIEDSQNDSAESSPRLFSLSPPQIVIYSEDIENVERSITNVINKEKNKEKERQIEFEKSKERDVEDEVELISSSPIEEYSEEEMDDETPSSIQFESPQSIYCEEQGFFEEIEEIWYTSAIEENLHQLQNEQGVFPPSIYPNYNFPSLPSMTPDSPYTMSFISYAPMPDFVADQIKARPKSSPTPIFESFEKESEEEEVFTPFSDIADCFYDDTQTEKDGVNDECEKKKKKEKKEKRKSKMRKSQSAPDISNNKNEEIESPHLSCKRIRLNPIEQTPNNFTFWSTDSSTSTSFLAEILECAIPASDSPFPAIPNYTRYIKPFQK